MRSIQLSLHAILGIELVGIALLYVAQFYTGYSTTVLMGSLLLVLTPVLWTILLWHYFHKRITWYVSSVVLWLSSILLSLSAVTSVVLQPSYMHALVGNALEETTLVFLGVFITHVLVLHHLVVLTQLVRHILIAALGFINVALLGAWFITKQVPFDLSVYIATAATAFFVAYTLVFNHVKGKMLIVYYGVFLSTLTTLVLLQVPTEYVVLLLAAYVYVFFIRLKPAPHSSLSMTASVLLGCVLCLHVVVSGIAPATHVGISDGVAPVTQVLTLLNEGVVKNERTLDSLFGAGMNNGSYLWFQHNTHPVNSSADLDVQPVFIFSTAATYAMTTGLVGVFAWVFLFGSLVFLCVSTFRRRQFPTSPYGMRDISFCFGLLLLYGTVLNYFTLLVTAALLAFATQQGARRHRGVLANPSYLYLSLSGLLLLSVVCIQVAISLVSANIQYQKAVSILVTQGDMGVVEAQFLGAISSHQSALTLRHHSQFLQLQVRNMLTSDGGDQVALEQLLSEAVTSAASAILVNRYDYESWLVLGNVYFVMARLEIEDAEKSMNVAYQKAVELAPRQPKVWYAFARATYELGRYDESDSYSAHALSLYPEYIAAVALKKKLANERELQE